MGFFRADLVKPPGWPPQEIGSPRLMAAHKYGRERDPVGHLIHTIFAVLFLATLPFSTAFCGFSSALLGGHAILRLHATWRSYPVFLRHHLFWIILNFYGWMIISLAWTSDPGQGWDEIWSGRMILLPLALWPVLDRIPLLIGALLLGVFAQNCCQFLQIFDLLPLSHHTQNVDGLIRYGGYMYFIQTGAWCAAALAWHAGAVLQTRGWVRALSILGLIAAAGGLIASGSRGPWIAALIIPFGVIISAIRRPLTRRAALILGIIGVVALLSIWPMIHRPVTSRIDAAYTELRLAVEEQNYGSSVGLRIGLWRWAWEMYRDAPILGSGAGGYRTSLDELPLFSEVGNSVEWDEVRINWHRRDHAHSSFFHILATLGTPGIALFLILLIFLTVRCLHLPPTHPWADGLLFVLLIWIIGALFDCYHLNGNLVGLLAFIITITLASADKMAPALTPES